MTECEFKKECLKSVWGWGDHQKCDHERDETFGSCLYRKFAILVWNKAIEDFKLHLLSHRPYMTGHLTQANVMEIAEALRETSP